jgi:hypothetical protein
MPTQGLPGRLYKKCMEVLGGRPTRSRRPALASEELAEQEDCDAILYWIGYRAVERFSRRDLHFALKGQPRFRRVTNSAFRNGSQGSPRRLRVGGIGPTMSGTLSRNGTHRPTENSFRICVDRR